MFKSTNFYRDMIAYAPPREGGSDIDLGENFDDDNNDNSDDGTDDEVDNEELDNLTDDNRTPIDKQLEDQIDRQLNPDGKKAKAKGKDEGKNTQQEQRRGAPNAQGNRPLGKNDGGNEFLVKFAKAHLTQDAKGNLVDPASGRVVAAAGRERYYFEQARNRGLQGEKLMTALQKTADLGRKFEAQVQAYEGITKNSGLDVKDQTQAIQLFKSYKANPAATIKYILTEAQANGIDLSTVLGKGASSIDMGAIKSLIQGELSSVTKPMQEGRARQEKIRELNEEAARQTEEFFEQFPDAAPHEAMLANILNQNHQIKPEVAYFRLKEFAVKNKLDWSKPLQPQMLARRGKSQQQNERNDVRPMPNGRAQRQLENGRDQDASFGAGASTDDIVRAAMLEAGMNLN